ncbi:manganese efflux pump MntP family protein [Oscillospiraceae bacterium MB08-C2-2]|nr:manganese efflux pump MntP family protein [Oscillospiraceae bacterium MB08-C2-2]
MSWIELFVFAVGVSMDAFAVAICLGLSMKKATLRKGMVVGLYFGLFQAIMPLAGYLLGAQFADYITAIDHWIAFVLLAILGGKMIVGSLKKEHEEASREEASLQFSAMLPLAVATSIDALAVGVSFAFLKVEVIPAVFFIGSVTFLLSMLGVKLGHICGAKLKQRAEFSGGGILVLMGLEILLEHMELIPF